MTHTSKPETIAKFKALNPTLLMQIQEYQLYEHPTKGDEAPVMMLTPDDVLVSTGFWDLGDFDLDLCHELDPLFKTYTPYAHSNDI